MTLKLIRFDFDIRYMYIYMYMCIFHWAGIKCISLSRIMVSESVVGSVVSRLILLNLVLYSRYSCTFHIFFFICLFFSEILGVLHQAALLLALLLVALLDVGSLGNLEFAHNTHQFVECLIHIDPQLGTALYIGYH